LDDACSCPVCARWSRAYLRHLLVVDEPTAPRLLTIHNVWWTLRLVEEVRAAIGAGSLESVRSRVRAAYE
jgi:queuine tRNA-ribosyltransferase